MNSDLFFQIIWQFSRMFPSALRCLQTFLRTLPQRVPLSLVGQQQRTLSSHAFPLFRCVARLGQPSLVRPAVVTVIPESGYKVRAVVKKRCEKCYFVKRQGRLFVECKVKPRHKQMQRIGKKDLFRED